MWASIPPSINGSLLFVPFWTQFPWRGTYFCLPSPKHFLPFSDCLLTLLPLPRTGASCLGQLGHLFLSTELIAVAQLSLVWLNWANHSINVKSMTLGSNRYQLGPGSITCETWLNFLSISFFVCKFQCLMELSWGFYEILFVKYLAQCLLLGIYPC